MVKVTTIYSSLASARLFDASINIISHLALMTWPYFRNRNTNLETPIRIAFTYTWCRKFAFKQNSSSQFCDNYLWNRKKTVICDDWFFSSTQMQLINEYDHSEDSWQQNKISLNRITLLYNFVLIPRINVNLSQAQQTHSANVMRFESCKQRGIARLICTTIIIIETDFFSLKTNEWLSEISLATRSLSLAALPLSDFSPSATL